jgi:hypothetical protein
MSYSSNMVLSQGTSVCGERERERERERES